MRHFNSLSNFRWFATVILLTMLGVSNAWGDSGTLTSAELSTNITNTTCAYGTPKSAYLDQGVTYTMCGYTDAASRPWIQLKKDAGAYIKIAVASSKEITGVSVTITSTSNSKGGVTDITKHSDFSGTVYLRTSATSTPATGALTSSSSVSDDVVSLSISSGSYYELYIQTDPGSRVWSITVNYQSKVSCSNDPSVGAASIKGTFFLTTLFRPLLPDKS